MHTRVDEIFYRATELSGEDRASFVEEACGDDGDLRRQVLKLLSAHQQTEDFSGSLWRPREDGDDAWVGTEIGPFTIRSKLGGGGFGQVFLAERTDEYRQLVAIKLLRRDVLGGAEGRFEAERQLLADLHHPHIARFYYGGRLGDGRRYIVMEFVDGEPVTEYCRRHRGSVDDTLALFRQICEAVAYAHSYGVIHRDIKPANVLVNKLGDSKLLDFGIAKQLSGELSETTATAGGVAPFTPQYASPEQVLQRRLTAASDVYGLGLLLFEMLTGERPYVASGKSLEGIIQSVCHANPPRPSDVMRKGETSEKGRRPEAWRAVRGDLDQVVLKTLAKAPQDRYGTVAALIADLDAFREGRQVQARPLPTAVRTWRACRRRPVVASLAAGLVFSLVAATAITSWQLLEIRRAERDRIDAQLSRLADAPAEVAPMLIRDLSTQERALDASRVLLDRVSEDDRAATRYRLVLLDSDEAQRDEVYRYMLEAPISEALLCARELALAVDDETTRPDLPASPQPDSQWLRRTAYRIAIDAGAPETDGSRLARAMVAEVEDDPGSVESLAETFSSVRDEVFPELVATAAEEETSLSASLAATRQALAIDSRPERLAQLISSVRPECLRLSLREVGSLESRDAVADLLAAGTDSHNRGGMPPGRATANAAIALTAWGRAAEAGSLLASDATPEARYRFVADAAAAGLGVAQAAAWLDAKLPAQLSQVPMLLVGALAKGSETLPEAVESELLRSLSIANEPAVWAASAWAMRAWVGSEFSVMRAIRASAANERPTGGAACGPNDHILLNCQPGPLPQPPGRRRLVDGSLAVAPRPSRVRRHFAIAMFETTVRQYQEFDREWRAPGDEPPRPDWPVFGVSAQQAAAYCNWLSKLDGIPEEQWCYIPDRGSGGALRSAPDLLERQGYRLPTETEWEHACRSDTKTRWFFGDDSELLPLFATVPPNSPLGTKAAVGVRMPGPNGLFDMYGNADEICDDDPGREYPITPGGYFVTRGGAAGDIRQPGSEDGNIGLNDPENPGAVATGFRVCRSVIVDAD
ncbi:protein kinase [Botrimarina sp.]|uniref:protein kinase domain-containing protein n=1 Tax=Botrimarina sp. TaxID=2795802 RepID=UPI0032EE388D